MSVTTKAFIFPVLIPLNVNVPQLRAALTSQALFVILNLAYVASLFSPDQVFGGFALHDRGGVYQYFTYGFLHEGLPHLLVNLYFLYLFGAPLESRIGWGRMAALFVFSAVVGGMAHRLFGHVPDARPLAGASAAVFGVIGSYVMLFPFSLVRCFFCLFILVVPFYRRTIRIHALFFVPAYWGLLWAARMIPIDSLFVRAAGEVSAAAHLGGFIGGMAFAAAFYGFGAFTHDAELDRAIERRLEEALAERIKSGKSRKLPAQQGVALFESHALADVPEPLHPLHRLVTQRMGVQARNVYSELLKIDPQACLTPGVQMELARMLIELEDNELAVRALEILVERHPKDDIATMARLELGRLLIMLQRDPDRAGFLLRACRSAEPPVDVAREVEALLDLLKGVVAPPALPRLFDDFDPASLGADLPESTENVTPKTQVRRLFGNPEDTDNFLPAQSAAAAPASGGGAVRGSAADSDSGFEINLDDSDFLREKGIAAKQEQPISAPPFTLMPPNTPHAIDPEPAIPGGSDLRRWPGGEIEIARVEVRPVPVARQTVRARPASPVAPDETSPAVYISALVTTESNRERALRLREEKGSEPSSEIAKQGVEPRYSLILAPGAQVDIASVMEVMGPVLGPPAGLSKDGVHQAILRRRGMLAHTLKLDEARELASALARLGQATALVPESSNLEFGEPIDLVTLTDSGDMLRLTHDQGSEERRWKDAICLGGGWVGTAPGAPCRAALDLFFRSPRGASNKRFRLWENTFGFPPGGHGDRHDRFIHYVKLLARKTERAIQTRTLNSWIEEEDAPETARFSNPIEYDNFLRWHLLAYCVPSQRFEPHP